MVNFVKSTASIAFTMVVVIITCLASFFAFGPRLETRFMPVMTDAEPTVTIIDEQLDEFRIETVANKKRACHFDGSLVMIARKGVWSPTTVRYEDPGTKAITTDLPKSYPPGVFKLSTLIVSPIGDRVRVYHYHTCHPFWQSMTLVYEIEVKK